MKIKQGFVLRKVGGDFVVVPVGEMSKKFHGMINLNVTGQFLWTFFSENHTEEEGIAALCAEYDVAREIAERDVKKFLRILTQNGFAD